MPTEDLEERVLEAENQVEILQESLVDMQLALDSKGWSQFGDSETEFTHKALVDASKMARVMSVANPLIRRGLSLRAAYVWGQGVQVAAREDSEEEGAQDLNAVIQAFLDDQSTKAVLSGGQAQEMNEHTLGTDGNVFFVLFTSPLTGRVQVRTVPLEEMREVVTNPDDRTEVWFFKRQWNQKSFTRADRGVSTSTTLMTAYYPALGYAPSGAVGGRVKAIDGDPVIWDAPVLRVAANRLDGWKYGIGDAYAAMFWARAYKEFLEDWARLVKALSRFAWKAQAKTGAGRAQARQAMAARPVNPSTGQVADSVVTSDDVTLTAIPKTGATIDSESGRPLAAMTAAAFDVPVTMLLGDPGITGARATAETLDQPMELGMGMRRELWSEALRRIMDYVIDQAVKAPQGPLRGTRRIDPSSGREVIALLNDQDRSIEVNWPSLGETPLNILVEAISKADATGKLPDETVARLLMAALKVENVDELISQMTNDAGEFESPGVKRAMDQANQAAQAALEAVRNGDYPTDKE